jgi:hypothetical protein
MSPKSKPIHEHMKMLDEALHTEGTGHFPIRCTCGKVYPDLFSYLINTKPIEASPSYNRSLGFFYLYARKCDCDSDSFIVLNPYNHHSTQAKLEGLVGYIESYSKDYGISFEKAAQEFVSSFEAWLTTMDILRNDSVRHKAPEKNHSQ